ncbi:hypothetical protein MKW92_046969, partial [Papaver armeniacum]
MSTRPSLTNKNDAYFGIALGNRIYAISSGDGVKCLTQLLEGSIPTYSMHQK